nr:putative reverse transcriptase domain, zinc finger, CCHC-type, retrotransposon Gag domain protein [Tanacetum cinerariifolium]
MSNYQAKKKQLGNQFNITCYKEPETIESEGGEYNFDEHIKDFVWDDDKDGDAIELAFSNTKIVERQHWLQAPEDLDLKEKGIPYRDFMNKEFKQYAMADLQISIPSMVDGLKPRERKILFYTLKKPIIQKIKVTEFSIYLLNHSPNHDGEVTLVDTIIGMAQNYVGSNNINLLQPKGEFGTRWMGGKDHADGTLLFTRLSPITQYLFHKDDELLLNDLNEEDDQSIGPAWFIPIIPMVLVNGSEARGDWSSFIPRGGKDIKDYKACNDDDTKGKLKKYDTPEELLEDFYRFRLNFYEKRKASLLHKLKILDNKEKFAHEVGMENLKAREETPPKEEDEDVEVKGYDGYDYLISQLPDICDPEYIEELEKEREATATKLEHLNAATPESLWRKDLIALDEQLALEGYPEAKYTEAEKKARAKRTGDAAGQSANKKRRMIPTTRCGFLLQTRKLRGSSPIVYSAAANGAMSNFKIQPNLIAIVLVFRGHEEPYVHLWEFFSIADTYQVNNTTKDRNPEAIESPKVREGGMSSTTTPYPAALEKSASARLAKNGPYSEDIWDTFKQRKLKATFPKKIDLTEHASAVLSSSLPPKFKDPREPLILVVVGNIAIKKALLDLVLVSTSYVDVIDEEVQKHAPCTLKDDPLELYLTDENEGFLDIAKPSLEVPLTLELKPLLSNLIYAFLGHKNTLPVIVASDLSGSQEEELLKVLSKYKATVEWTIADLKGISPSLLKKEVLKWLDAGIIYPTSNSKWVSPTQTVPKKASITVVETESVEKLTTRQVTGWRVCIDYRKLNNATSKDHFPLPFIDQIVEKLSGQKFYCFLNGYFRYNQIPIHPDDHAKTTFTCPYRTFSFRRMLFGLCNAPATFQRCMMSIFSDMVGESVEIFMDDFSIFGQSFEICLGPLERFKVDRAKEKIISTLPPPTNTKAVRSFLGHARFYRRFIKDFSAISKPLCNLLLKEARVGFNESCLKAFNMLKQKLVEAPILQSPD